MSRGRSWWRSPEVAVRVATRQELLIRQEGVCAYCGRELVPGNMTLDHVWPESWPNRPPDDQNLVLACGRCNGLKGSQDPRVFVRKRRCAPGALIFRLYPELRRK